MPCDKIINNKEMPHRRKNVFLKKLLFCLRVERECLFFATNIPIKNKLIPTSTNRIMLIMEITFTWPLFWNVPMNENEQTSQVLSDWL